MPIVLLIAALLVAGCGADAALPADGGGDLSGAMAGGDLGGRDATGGGNPDAAAAPDGAALPDGGTGVGPDAAGPCVRRSCQGKIYECGDCIDNDGDGKIDSDDPECLGACQNNERGFSGNIPGQNNAPCKADCYFDQDTGSGNDSCEWDHRCDPHEVAPAFAPEAGCGYDPGTKFSGNVSCATKLAAQPKQCHDVCGPLTPNGCDCFGCCVMPPSVSVTEGVWLGSRDANDVPSCDLAHANDPARCKPCQIVTSCFKGCGRCQLCVGKAKVPEDCFPGGRPDGGGGGGLDGGGGLQCPGGEQPCGLPGLPACRLAFYCITGCCQPIIN